MLLVEGFHLVAGADRLRDVTHRIAAVLLSVLLLHLNFARADVACSAHAGHSAKASQGHHAGAAHHEMPSSAPGPHSEKSCDTPAQADCCLALTSCSVALGAADASDVSTSERPHDGVVAATMSAPVSRLVAPEPPPPRL